MNCKNCGNPVNNNFCSICGQRTTVERIKFKSLIDEFQNNILQINRGFLFTIKELFLKPGDTIFNFLSGKRKPYYKPISFLIISVTLYVLISYLLSVDSVLIELISSFKSGWENASQKNQKFILDNYGILNWLSTNQIYLVILLLPIFAFASFITFIGAKYNYYEHIVLQLYITGQQFLILSIGTLIFFFSKDILLIFILVGGVSFSIFTYYQFFGRKSLAEIVLRYILQQIIFFISYFIISFIVIFLGLIITKLF